MSDFELMEEPDELPASGHEVKRFVSHDKHRVLSIIRSGVFFRFVEDSWVYQPPTASVGGYHYWEQTFESGLYENALSAEAEALASIPWLRAEISS